MFPPPPSLEEMSAKNVSLFFGRLRKEAHLINKPLHFSSPGFLVFLGLRLFLREQQHGNPLESDPDPNNRSRETIFSSLTNVTHSYMYMYIFITHVCIYILYILGRYIYYINILLLPTCIPF